MGHLPRLKENHIDSFCQKVAEKVNRRGQGSVSCLKDCEGVPNSFSQLILVAQQPRAPTSFDSYNLAHKFGVLAATDIGISRGVRT